MIGGLLKSASVTAFVAAAGLSVGALSAQAADLGGDCCADLEERIAELEATTARKGNRKVSLTIYGQVTTAVMFWDADNGVAGDPRREESNVYVVDPQTSGTRFGFKGSARITSDWSAGYHIELQWQQADANSAALTRDSDEAPELPEFRQAHWWVKSKQLGKLRVGQADTANSGIAEIDLSITSIADAMSSSQAGSGIIRQDGGPAMTNFEFNRQNVVRYDTPTIAGFIVSAAWGEDDIWDVALRYAGEFGGFKIAGGIAYGESTDTSNGAGGIDDRPTEIINGGLSILHTPTGLFATGSAGERSTEGTVGDDTFWFVKGGIQQKWNSLGKTAIFGMGGEYEERDGDDTTYWGVGAVQQIDAAAMDLYISYRHYDISDFSAGTDPEFDTVVAGGRVKF